MPKVAKQTTGRTSELVLRKNLIDDLCMWIRAGHYVSVACENANVNYRTFFLWRERGEAVAETVAAHPDPDTLELSEYDDACFRLVQGIREAEGIAEERAVKCIREQMPEDWRAAAWFLERRFPNRWGKIEALQEQSKPRDPIAERAEDDPRVRQSIDDLVAALTGEE